MNPPWRSSISGPNAVTWPAFWAVLVVSVLLNLPDRYTDWSDGNAWRNLLAIALAVAAMFAVMRLLAAVLLRDAGQRPHPWRVLGIFVIGALVRAGVLAALISSIGTGESRLLFRVMSSLLIVVPILVITAGLVDLVRTSATRRAGLQAEARTLAAAEAQAKERTTHLQEGATARVRVLLLDRLQAMRSGAGGALGGDLRRDVEQVIRPMSHRMATDDAVGRTTASVADRGRISWGEVARSASLGRPFRPVAIAFVAAIASVNALVVFTGNPVRGLGYAVAQWVIVFSAFTALDRLLVPAMRRMGTGMRSATFGVGSVVGMVAAGLLLGWLIIGTGGIFAWRIPVAMMTLGPLIVWALAADQGFRQQVAATEADLRASNARLQASAALAGSVLWHEERRLSRALHGPIQAAVTAAAMRIDAGDEGGAERLLVDAIGHLSLDAQEQRGVAEALADVAAAWDGLCTVRTHLDPSLERQVDARPPLAASFIDICTEACSNAVRHGGAEHVVVVARRQGDALELVVSDDGAPTGAQSPGGLGTAMLDDVTLEWHRRREGQRTVLRATLPLAPG